MERPEWAEGLEAKGVYFEGMVSDADQRVERHNLETVTSYGTRTSRKVPVVNTPPPTPQLKENVKLSIIHYYTTLHHFLSISVDEQRSVTGHILL